MTPRMLLIAASRVVESSADRADAGRADEDAWALPEAAAEDRERRAEALARAWQEQMDRARGLLDQANEMGRAVEAELLGDALGAAIQLVPAMRVDSSNYGQVTQLAVTVEGERLLVAILARSHPRSVAAALDTLVRVAEQSRVLAVRERVHELRPTWRACLEKRDRLLASPNAQWLDLEREDAARLLALQGLLSDARSRDLTDPIGRPFEAATVRQWAQAELDVEQWAPIRALRELRRPAFSSPEEALANATPGLATAINRAEPGQVVDPSVEPGHVGPAIGMLLQLRVASLDRLVREVGRVHGPVGRNAVLAELEGAPARVQWFGRSVVAIKEAP
jgi:hypothetical protein